MPSYQGSGSKRVSERPLNKGMVRDVQSNILEPGTVYTADNFVVDKTGLKRREGLTRAFNLSLEVKYPPLRDVMTLWNQDGTHVTVILDNKFLYTINNETLQPYYMTYETGTVSVDISSDDSTVVGDSTNWYDSDEVYIGDVIVIDPGGTAEERTVSWVKDNTHIEVDTPLSQDYSAGASYEIRKSVTASSPFYVDSTIINDEGTQVLVATDGRRPMVRFDGTTLETFKNSSGDTVSFTCHCVMFYQDRLWCGNITDDSGNVYRQRVVWSTALDKTDFGTGDMQWFYDMPYTPGQIYRLVPLGDLIIAYFEDTIWVGRPTQVGGNLLPYSFSLMQTGKVGLVGTKAVSSWIDGHFFIGKDDVYYLSQDASLKPLECPVAEEIIVGNSEIWKAFVAPQPGANRVAFGIPTEDAGNYINEIWFMDMKTGAWSKASVPGITFLGTTNVIQGLTWDTLLSDVSADTRAWDGDDMMGRYPGWNAIFGSSSGSQLFAGWNGVLHFFSDIKTQDGTDPDYYITGIIETRDYDYNEPDRKKTWRRFNLKIDRELENDLTISIKGSTNRGRDWKDFGNITIPAGQDEGSVNFRITGSTCRFRLETNAFVPPFKIIEFGFIVKARQTEVHFGDTD